MDYLLYFINDINKTNSIKGKDLINNVGAVVHLKSMFQYLFKKIYME